MGRRRAPSIDLIFSLDRSPARRRHGRERPRRHRPRLPAGREAARPRLRPRLQAAYSWRRGASSSRSATSVWVAVFDDLLCICLLRSIRSCGRVELGAIYLIRSFANSCRTKVSTATLAGSS
ncbi:hypothetical protein PVAP13_6KG122900 [Panicum virgatum]|uniref:Uncharacterized protein n=1 Tax=Panicum virgatum TaxID=38727 RepID=A0A8T0RI54_PANVG|nr:hypothetical protein PVAP13_6KG122900 [Panicum virgatum]